MLELLSRWVFIDTVIEMNAVATRDVWLIRHGETEWTVSRRHTGLTDLPLTRAGEDQARSLRNCLQGASFERVFCSPLKRAARTCELSGYGSVAEVDRDLVEWNYGDYEGEKRPQILAERPTWIIFETVVPMVNHQRTWPPEPIDFFPAFERYTETSLFSQAVIF